MFFTGLIGGRPSTMAVTYQCILTRFPSLVWARMHGLGVIEADTEVEDEANPCPMLIGGLTL